MTNLIIHLESKYSHRTDKKTCVKCSKVKEHWNKMLDGVHYWTRDETFWDNTGKNGNNMYNCKDPLAVMLLVQEL